MLKRLGACVALGMVILAQSLAHAQGADQIVYAAGALGSRALFVMNSDGGNPHKLTSTGDSSEPNWSPDRRQIVFSSKRGDDTHLYAINADGSGERQITRGSAVTNAQPNWSPDGANVIFISNQSGKADVFMVSASGGDSSKVSSDPKADFDTPSWSPDGKSIVYSSNKTGQSEIWIMANNGSNPRQLTKHADGDYNAPAWSPDSKLIAFVSIANGESEIYTVEASGKNQSLVVTIPEQFVGSLTWSPDGKQLAFMATKDQAHTISSVTINGGTLKQLSSGNDNAGWPSWASFKKVSPVAVDTGSGDGPQDTAGGDEGGSKLCAGSPRSRLTVGMKGRVTYEPPMSSWVRKTPDGSKIRQIAPGTTFTVKDGPECARNLTWWQIQTSAVTGWAAEGEGSDYYLEPAR